MLFGRDCFALRKRFFCVSTEVVCQIKGGSFFKSLEIISVYAKETSVWPFRQASAVIGEGIDQQGHFHPERIKGKMQQNRTVM